MNKKEVKWPPREVKYRNGKTREEMDAQWASWMEDAPTDTHINRSSAMREILGRPSVKAKASASQKLVQNNPEVRARQSASMKLTMSTPEARAKMSAALKLAHNRPETRAKNNAAIKLAMNNPEVRAKISAAAKLAMSTPEARAKISAANRHILTEEEKLLYKQALKHGPMQNFKVAASWRTTARKFGLNPDKLSMYAKGQNLKDLE